MNSMVEAPVAMVESVAELRLPPGSDSRLKTLMDRNTNAELSEDERTELESLVELSQVMSLVRAQALQILGRKP